MEAYLFDNFLCNRRVTFATRPRSLATGEIMYSSSLVADILRYRYPIIQLYLEYVLYVDKKLTPP